MHWASYFHDGYTRAGYVRPSPGLHEALRFDYRPALVEERSQLVDAAAGMRSDAYDRQVAAFLATKVLSWDLTDGAGGEVAVSPTAMLRLQPELFVKLYRVVLGWVGSDVDPRWSEDSAAEAVQIEHESALAGKTVGDLRQEADEKN